MFFEYLKKNRWALFNKWIVSAAIVLIAFLFIMGILLLTPVGLAVIALLSTNLVGFSFLFLSGLFFLSIIGSLTWLVIKQKYDALKPTSEGKNEMSDEKKYENLPLNPGKGSTHDLTLSRLFEKDGVISEGIVENKVPKNTDSYLTLEAYSKESEQFISKARKAIFDKTFKNPEVFNALEKNFKELKQKYYQLARMLHPDKNGKENEERFKQLGNYYEDIGEAFERLKMLHDEEDIWEFLKRMDEKLKHWDETLQKIRDQQAQMLRYLAEMKKDNEETKKHNEETKKHNEEMRKLNNQLGYLAEIKKEREERKKLNDQLEHLIDQNTIDISDPEVQQYLASFQRERQESQQTNTQQTSSNSTIGMAVTRFFSEAWSFFGTTKNSSADTKNQQKIENSGVSESSEMESPRNSNG
jgi:curved DNA-binding protein CbpA